MTNSGPQSKSKFKLKPETLTRRITGTCIDYVPGPSPSEEDIQFILNEVRHYLSPDVEVRRGDVLSAW